MCGRHRTGPPSRRQLLRGGGLLAAAAVGTALPIRSAPPRADEASPPVSGAAALERLIAGNIRYIEGTPLPHDFRTTQAALAEGQRPHSIVLSCSDSRVAPEFAFDQARGELFVVRVAGNGLDTAGLASMEYAVEVLGASLIMVLGHSACGAVGAAVKVAEEGARLPGHLSQLIEPIVPAVEAVEGEPGDLLSNAIRQNVLRTMQRLQRAGPIVGPAILDGRIKLAGGIYELATGKVDFIP